MSEECCSKNDCCSNSENRCSSLNVLSSGDPDCIKCLRTKLRAVSAAVFLRDETGWWLDRFQGDKPYDAAEAEFQYMLTAGIPDAVLAQGRGFFLVDDREIALAFPKGSNLFSGQSVIAAPVQRGKSFGVRLAWRDQADPFTSDDLKTIECVGDCPAGCG